MAIAAGQDITFTYRGSPVTYKVVYNETTGKFWLDRNLGATQVATSSTDSDAYGDLFQWGRLDDNHQDRTSNTTEILSDSNDPEHGDFILAPNSPYDWRNPQNDALWNPPDYTNLIASLKSQGFRLPTETEWETERLSWSSNDYDGAYASPLKLTAAGNRNYSNGSLLNVGTVGYYWSSTIDGTNARHLYFYSANANMYSYYRANGFTVRLIYDRSLILSPLPTFFRQ